jgi:murein DD-endopeptidase MepM/ murein hydrolase activator NlpD
MFNIILNKIFFYFVIFVLTLSILTYAIFIMERYNNSISQVITIHKIATIKKLPESLPLAESSTVKEIVFMDNIPVKTGNLSSKYGIRKDPFNGRKRMHYGIDIAAKRGTNIYPLGRGKVIFSGRRSGYGNMIEILHGDAIISRYAHLRKSLVKKGQIVNKQDVIALVGNTGRSTGPHLHLEIAINGERVDPEIFLIGNIAYK